MVIAFGVAQAPEFYRRTQCGASLEDFQPAELSPARPTIHSLLLLGFVEGFNHRCKILKRYGGRNQICRGPDVSVAEG